MPDTSPPFLCSRFKTCSGGNALLGVKRCKKRGGGTRCSKLRETCVGSSSWGSSYELDETVAACYAEDCGKTVQGLYVCACKMCCYRNGEIWKATLLGPDIAILCFKQRGQEFRMV